MGRGEVPAVGIHRHVVRDDIQHHRCLGPNLGVLGEIDQINQRRDVLVEVHVRMPFREPDGAAQVQPLQNQRPGVVAMLRARHADVRKYGIREHLTGQVLGRMEQDLMVFRPVTHLVHRDLGVHLGHPVLVSQQSVRDRLAGCFIQSPVITIDIEHPDERRGPEVRTVVAQRQVFDRGSDGGRNHGLAGLDPADLTIRITGIGTIVLCAEIQVFDLTLVPGIERNRIAAFAVRAERHILRYIPGSVVQNRIIGRVRLVRKIHDRVRSTLIHRDLSVISILNRIRLTEIVTFTCCPATSAEDPHGHCKSRDVFEYLHERTSQAELIKA